MGDGSGHGESGKRKYANIFKGSLVLLGTSPRPKTKGEESEPDQIEDNLPPPREDLPKRVVEPPKGYLPEGSGEEGKTGHRVVMVVGCISKTGMSFLVFTDR